MANRRLSLPPEGYYLAPHITVHEIQEAVSEFFGIPLVEMASERKGWEVSHPRQVAMYLARELTAFSYPMIGRRFGDRDHTTVMHAVRQVEARMLDDEDLRIRVADLKAALLSDEGKPADTYLRVLEAA